MASSTKETQTSRINDLIRNNNSTLEHHKTEILLHKQVIEEMWNKADATATQTNANLSIAEQMITRIPMEAKATKDKTDMYRTGIDDFADAQ